MAKLGFMTGLGSKPGAILDAETIEIDRIRLEYEGDSKILIALKILEIVKNFFC